MAGIGLFEQLVTTLALRLNLSSPIAEVVKGESLSAVWRIEFFASRTVTRGEIADLVREVYQAEGLVAEPISRADTGMLRIRLTPGPGTETLTLVTITVIEKKVIVESNPNSVFRSTREQKARGSGG